MTIQEDLALFYDAEATKYAQTREKFRSDAAFLLDEFTSNPLKSLRILDFGCGSGRLLKLLTQIKGKRITYVGVDLSAKLLALAKKQVKPTHRHLSCTFVCEDILSYIGTCKQESFDYVVGISSFQHIPSKRDRYYLLKNSYRVLVYEGKLLMTNWSFSVRFLKKYQRSLFHAIQRYVLSWGKFQWNDVSLPWKAQGKTFWRYYHMFTKKELISLVHLSGFLVHTAEYLDTKGNTTPDWKDSKTTLILAQKSVFSSGEGG